MTTVRPGRYRHYKGNCEPTTHRGPWRIIRPPLHQSRECRSEPALAAWRLPVHPASLSNELVMRSQPCTGGTVSSRSAISREITGFFHLKAGFVDRRTNGGKPRSGKPGSSGKLPGPKPMSTMRCRSAMTEGLRCVVGKKSTMRSRFASIQVLQQTSHANEGPAHEPMSSSIVENPWICCGLPEGRYVIRT